MLADILAFAKDMHTMQCQQRYNLPVFNAETLRLTKVICDLQLRSHMINTVTTTKRIKTYAPMLHLLVESSLPHAVSKEVIKIVRCVFTRNEDIAMIIFEVTICYDCTINKGMHLLVAVIAILLAIQILLDKVSTYRVSRCNYWSSGSR